MSKFNAYLLLSVLLFTTYGCGKKETTVQTIKMVKTDTVSGYGHIASATFPGKIKAASDVSLAFRVAGTILKVNVDAGSYVKKGQLIAELDPRDYQVQVAATKAEYNKVKGEADRIIKLFSQESVSPNDYEKALYGLQQITAKYDAHKNALTDTKLYAPFNGYIQKKHFEANETIGAGTPVISMLNTENPELEINIPSAVYINKNNFDSYSCTANIFPNKTFSLDLIGITPKANLNQLYTARFRVKPIGGEFPGPGMSAMVTITYRSQPTQLTAIPLTATFEKDGASTVWVYNPQNSTVKTRYIKIKEIQTNGNVIIAEGLQAGEIIVVAGVNSLTENQQVKLLPPSSPTNIGGML